MAIAVLGFKSKKDCRAAIKKIVDRYSPEQEFFDPLLQRLFVEHPYHGSVPGPCYTKFKWITHTLPDGATTDRWFVAYNDELGWVGTSWNKCIQGNFNLDKELKQFARQIIGPLIKEHREKFPFCQYDNCLQVLKDVHHLVPMKSIVIEAIALLNDQDRANAIKMYNPLDVEIFALPVRHKFTQYILKRHEEPILMSLCWDHHLIIEGKINRQVVK